MKKLSHWTKSQIRNVDLFPQTVSLTYRGESKFKTIYGGLVSSVILIIIISYSVRLFKIMFDKTQTTQTLNTEIRDLQSETIDYQIGRDSLAFNFSPIGKRVGKFYDPTYFTITVRQKSRTTSSTGDTIKESEEREISI